MVRPTIANLNTLAELLREAQPLYNECRSILNYLDDGVGILLLPGSEDSTGGENDISSSIHAPTQHPSLLEPTVLDRKRVM